MSIFEVPGFFEAREQGPAVERSGIPAGHVAAVIVSVAEPDGLIAAPECLDDLKRFGGLRVISEIPGEEIDMLVSRLIDEQFRTVRIGGVDEHLIAGFYLLEKLPIFGFPPFRFEIGEDVGTAAPPATARRIFTKVRAPSRVRKSS